MKEVLKFLSIENYRLHINYFLITLLIVKVNMKLSESSIFRNSSIRQIISGVFSVLSLVKM